MVDPGVALTAFGLLVIVTAVVAWPRWGVLARLARMAHLSDAVLLEDALKHVYTCSSVGRPCSLESLAGQLELSTGKAAELLATLAASGLVANTPEGPRLTESGEASALRLVRTHRLWERYLADRTGVPAGEWHEEAERKEHRLSNEEVDELSARLGHPAWDPHGDPIPTASGDLPSLERSSLSNAEVGRTFEIVHLEDEPRSIYDVLLDDGLDLGSRITITRNDDSGVEMRSRGRAWRIDHVVAGNVTVTRLPESEPADGPVSTLVELAPGHSARVVGISPSCQGAQRRRLLDLGIVRGTEISAVLRSAAGDPIAYSIRGALIALRREQAGWIRVEMSTEHSNEGVA